MFNFFRKILFMPKMGNIEDFQAPNYSGALP